MSAAPLLLALGLTSAILFPTVGIALCAVVLFFQTVLIVVRAAIARWDVARPFPPRPTVDPVFTVHVATHNEPPVMVAATLRALADQTWPSDRYEVIVIDNNTADPALWTPIEALCAQLGERFTFLHRMGVREAKAGALTISLAHSRPDATHVVTVDADYRVDPTFLTAAAEALRVTGADYVQFPQAYLGCDRVAAGVDAELEEYFRTNARMADDTEAVLLTGTLCVISKEALVASGGWSGRTTTEDAEMGVRMCSKGYSGRFIGRVVGRGYLPFTLRDLERQRHRWTGGNLQTLFTHAAAILKGHNGMGWRRRGAIVSQLTAWLNLSLVPAVLLIAALVSGQGGGMLVTLAAASVLLCVAEIVFRLTWQGFRDGKPLGVVASAIGNRIALAPVSALATFEALLGRPMHFVVTDKTGTLRRRWHQLPMASLALFAAGLVALFPAVQHGGLALSAVLVLMTPLPAAIATARTLDRYRTSHKPADQGVPA